MVSSSALVVTLRSETPLPLYHRHHFLRGTQQASLTRITAGLEYQSQIDLQIIIGYWAYRYLRATPTSLRALLIDKWHMSDCLQTVLGLILRNRFSMKLRQRESAF
jgi:hypothetical protein